jgi:DNA-binding NarL/FixJ family response regulator
MKVLILEDDLSEEQYLQSLLSKEFPGIGVDVLRTETAFRNALAALRANPPSAIIVDLILRWSDLPGAPPSLYDPYDAGIRCQRLLAEDATTGAIPVVFYSVVDRSDVPVQLTKNCLYCQKSAAPFDLVRKLRSVLAIQEGLSAVLAQNRDGVFISYSHKDERWLTELLVTLTPYAADDRVKIWADTMLVAGQDWRKAIASNLHHAKVAVLLVSRYFLDSQFIRENELPILLDRAKQNGLKIFWIPVSASAFHKTPISRYHAASDPAKPLDAMNRSNLNRQLVKIADLLEKAVLAP